MYNYTLYLNTASAKINIVNDIGKMKDYEIAILLKMYDEGLIGSSYKAIEKVKSKIQWKQIANKYQPTKTFEKISRKLVKRRLLTDQGKSMTVLSLDKFGVNFVRGHLKDNPLAMIDLGI